MSAKSDYAIKIVLKHEGGLVDNSKDPGGITNYGISLRWAEPNLNFTSEDIKKLSKERATDIYKEYWWDTGPYEQINNTIVAAKFFDMSVNMGLKQASKIMQRAVSVFSPVVVDGQVGTQTIAAINNASADQLLDVIVEEQSDFYQDLAKSKSSMSVFLDGWLKRASWRG
jgi:lysozyme family protein